MDLGRSFIRLLVTLLIGAIPPLILFVGLTSIASEWLLDRGVGNGTQLAVGVAATVAWAGIVAGVAARRTRGEERSMIELVERGATTNPTSDGLSQVQQRLAATLDERNRQIGNLAEVARRAPIADDAQSVTRSMAAAARSLTDDPTWVVVVLRSSSPAVLPPGVYTPSRDEGAQPVEDLHRWASTVDPGSETPSTARHAVGPWGAFVVVDVGATDHLAALLMAPWEGRVPPSPAELSLLTLLGQHAATAIEHALLYTRLRAQTDELNRMAAVQTDFLRGVTHDLQTPLTSIGALASELRQMRGMSQSGQDDLATIAHQADRLRRMVAQLLAVSRLEAGALSPRSEVFRLEPILRRTWDALRADRHLQVEVEGEPLLVAADPDRVEQVLWALLDNAVKYSPTGSTISVRITPGPPQGERGPTDALLTVTDAGTGMDELTRDHAFDQFYRSETARQLAPDGSGIGLFAARGLIRAMGGDISIASQLGKGTVVTLTLPAEPAERLAHVE